MGIIGFHNLNLAIRADRKNICIGNYDSREISPSDVTFHVAPYGRDYKNSHDMCDAAIADGYPIFDSLREYPLGDLGYLWGTTKILETIRDDNATRLAIIIKTINFSSYPIHNLNLSAAPCKIVLPIHFCSYRCHGMHLPIAASADPKHRY